MKRIITILYILVSSLELTAGTWNHIGKPYFQNISALEYDGHNRNFDLVCDGKGRIVIANFEGLVIGDGKNWTMTHTPGISRITDVYKSENGRIWVGGLNVLGYLDEKDDIIYIADDTDSLSRFGEVKNIHSDGNDLLFNTDDIAFRLHDGKIEIDTASVRPTIPQEDDVNCSIVIGDQNLTALGTVSHGVVFIDESGHEVYRINSDDGLCSDNVSALDYDGKGTVWGTTDNGIFRITVSPVISHFSQSDGLSGQVNTILSIPGKLLVGTLQGLFIKTDSDTEFRKCRGLDLACWQLVESDDKKIYAATAQGLYLYDKELIQLTSRHTLSVVPLNDGSVVTGEVDGMYRLYTDKGEEKLNSIPNVLKIKVDSTGGIIAVNYSQESYYAKSPDEYFLRTEGEGLSLLTEYTDSKGRFWHSGVYGDGIICDGLSDEENKWLKMLDKYTIDAICVSENTAFIGGNFGLVRMNLKNMKAYPTYMPELRFRSINISDISLNCSYYTDKIDPVGQMSYSYRIHHNGEWSDWSDDTSLSFDHIQSGDYALSVRCIDSFGNISMSEPVWFTIPPPIYLRWYAICFYLLLSTFLAIVSLQLRTRKHKIYEARLQQKVDERTAQLEEAQGKLLKQERDATVGKLTRGLIDRILNPMNYISNFSHLSIGLAKELQEDIEEEKECIHADTYEDCTELISMLSTNLDKIEKHGLSTSRILKAMEAILQDRRGTVELTDVSMICAQVCESFEKSNERDISAYGISLEWVFPERPVMASVDVSNFGKTVMSILANSIFAVVKKSQKTSSDRPVIGLSVEQGTEGKGAVIKIHDTGTGIESTVMEKIFDPFFTTKTTEEASGTGLYLCRQAISDMDGTIDIQSVKDKYTDVVITLFK